MDVGVAQLDLARQHRVPRQEWRLERLLQRLSRARVGVGQQGKKSPAELGIAEPQIAARHFGVPLAERRGGAVEGGSEEGPAAEKLPPQRERVVRIWPRSESKE